MNAFAFSILPITLILPYFLPARRPSRERVSPMWNLRDIRLRLGGDTAYIDDVSPYLLVS